MLQQKTAPAGASGRMSFREALLFVLVGAILIFAVDCLRRAPLSNDGYQYLSVATSIAHGKGIETPLVHFDTERSEGRIPAPMTTFAPGYPVAVALSSFFTGSVDHGARLISFAASILSALLIWALANFVRLDRGLTQVAIALLIFNACFLHFSSAVLTEPLFLLVSITGLLLVASSIGDLRGDQGSLWRLVLGEILVAASYSIRYAGVFLFAAVVVHAALSWALLRNRRSLFYLLSNAISGALMATIMVRNIVLVGNWKGGNGKHVSNSTHMVLGEYVRAQIHLLFGEHILDAWLICVLAFSVLAVLWGAWALLRSRPQLASLLPSGGFLLFLYGLVATAGLIYLGKTSDISFGTRMFFPLLPLYIIGALLIVRRGWLNTVGGTKPARYWQALALLFVVLYGWVNLREFNAPKERSLGEELQASFAKPMADGRPLRAWIDANIGRDEAVAADSGQATGYFLERPVLSLIESEYSTITWNQETLINQMRRLHVRFLILNLTLKPDADPVRTETEFLAKAICCRTSPGFHVVAENPDVRIFQMNDQ